MNDATLLVLFLTTQEKIKLIESFETIYTVYITVFSTWINKCPQQLYITKKGSAHHNDNEKLEMLQWGNTYKHYYQKSAIKSHYCTRNDDFLASKFNEKCNGKGQKLILVLSDFANVFGAYTEWVMLLYNRKYVFFLTNQSNTIRKLSNPNSTCTNIFLKSKLSLAHKHIKGKFIETDNDLLLLFDCEVRFLEINIIEDSVFFFGFFVQYFIQECCKSKLIKTFAFTFTGKLIFSANVLILPM
ncbi:hypothetical protein RFI_34234 [Reticulomyxa filosa]|uniref:Uncharacterized protein n=1 Tax=Reticulomyxa filosa TaxID=46433 RepID=X6LMK1_RETFI|nr:hypothetical protein RFI_34234 [Reticulomyxa filosa]|eukprot:ETO03178.1 hypothetical protein RFI_34234 [Reticulomyxa filosa]